MEHPFPEAARAAAYQAAFNRRAASNPFLR